MLEKIPNTNGLKSTGNVLLLQKLREGSMEAFTEIYERYQPKLYVFLYPFTGSSRHEVTEILQNVFVKLWLKREQLPDINNLEHYLQRMAKNFLLDYIKQQKIKNRHELSFAQMQTLESQTTENIIALNEYRKITEETIASLPERRRRIFKLSVLEGYSLDEITAITGLSKDVVKKQLYKARHSFKEQLQKKAGIDTNDIALIILLFIPFF